MLFLRKMKSYKTCHKKKLHLCINIWRYSSAGMTQSSGKILSASQSNQHEVKETASVNGRVPKRSAIWCGVNNSVKEKGKWQMNLFPDKEGHPPIQVIVWDFCSISYHFFKKKNKVCLWKCFRLWCSLFCYRMDF